MKKKIMVGGLVLMLLMLSASSITGQNEASVMPMKGKSNLGDLQFMWPAETICHDYHIVGCETNGTHFFITGGANGTDPNKVYIFDYDGNLVGGFDQQGTTDWGWIDMAWDGTYFYAGHENAFLIDQFTPDGTVVSQITAPVKWPVGMAYDPVTDHLWTTDRFNDQKLYEITKDGTVVNTFPNTKLIYGLAWDDVSPGGPFLWASVFVDPEPQCTFWQIDPTTGTYTGVSFVPQAPPGGSTSNKACALGFTTAWNTSAGVLFGIQQCDTPTPGDQIAGYFISNATVQDMTPPVTTCLLEGTMNGSVYISPVTITLTATDEGSGVDYTMYQLDGGNWTLYMTPVVVSGEGAHTVAFYSVDKAGNIETQQSQTFTIQYFTISIKGGMGVTVVIKNIGTIDQSNVPWSINLDGKLIFVGKSKSNKANIQAGKETTVKDFVLGFGKTNIIVTAGKQEKTVSAKVFLFLVLGVT